MARDLAPGDVVAKVADSGVIVHLEEDLTDEAGAEKVRAGTGEGREAYRRGLILALDQAVKRSFPTSRLWVEHSISLGYRCRLENAPDLSAEEIVRVLSENLRRVVNEDLPLEWIEADGGEAPSSYHDLPRWREGRKPLLLNKLGDSCTFAMGPCVPRTGWLGTWELRPQRESFVLRFPGSASWPEIEPWHPRPKLSREFDMEEKHGARMRVRTVSELNARIEENGGREVVVMSHFYQNYKLVGMVNALERDFPEKRIVMIAGPSSSGKTTVARLLGTYLKAMGFGVLTVSIDDYFKNRTETPVDSRGKLDFECLEAIETDLFARDIRRLLAGEEVRIPTFDFPSGTRREGTKAVSLGERDFLLIEGIHGLNDELTPGIDPSIKYKIYVSALTQLNIDRLTRMSTSDSRLLRRIVRDSPRRGYTAEETIGNWPMVRRGERKYIFPFQEKADVMFNSALPYELPVLKRYALPLLEEVTVGSSAYHTADRLLRLLDCVKTLNESLVPGFSLLREFIGGSAFEDGEDG